MKTLLTLHFSEMHIFLPAITRTLIFFFFSILLLLGGVNESVALIIWTAKIPQYALPTTS